MSSGKVRARRLKPLFFSAVIASLSIGSLYFYFESCYRPFPLSDSDLQQLQIIEDGSTKTSLDEVYLINLERSTDRLKKMHAELAKHSINFLHFKAIDGYQFEGQYERYLVQAQDQMQSIDTQKKYFYRYDEKINKYGLSIGELGNYFSHFEILNDIVDRELDQALILEDDTSLEENFKQKVSSLLAHAPKNWDILYLNCFADLAIGCKIDKLSATLNRRFVKLNKKCTAGNGAYIIGTQGAKKLLLNANPATNRTDERIAKEYFADRTRKFMAYCAYPELVKVGQSRSIIDEMGRHSERP